MKILNVFTLSAAGFLFSPLSFAEQNYWAFASGISLFGENKGQQFRVWAASTSLEGARAEARNICTEQSRSCSVHPEKFGFAVATTDKGGAYGYHSSDRMPGLNVQRAMSQCEGSNRIYKSEYDFRPDGECQIKHRSNKRGFWAVARANFETIHDLYREKYKTHYTYRIPNNYFFTAEGHKTPEGAINAVREVCNRAMASNGASCLIYDSGVLN